MPTRVIDPTQPEQIAAFPPDARQQAYARLLADAEGRGDRGASTQMTADILNAVDMGSAGRVSGMWGDHLAGLSGAGESMLAGVAAAYEADRARRRGSGRGRSTAAAPAAAPPAQRGGGWSDALYAYYQSLANRNRKPGGLGMGIKYR